MSRRKNKDPHASGRKARGGRGSNQYSRKGGSKSAFTHKDMAGMRATRSLSAARTIIIPSDDRDHIVDPIEF